MKQPCGTAAMHGMKYNGSGIAWGETAFWRKHRIRNRCGGMPT